MPTKLKTFKVVCELEVPIEDYQGELIFSSHDDQLYSYYDSNLYEDWSDFINHHLRKNLSGQLRFSNLSKVHGINPKPKEI